jgi:hypothetical protein
VDSKYIECRDCRNWDYKGCKKYLTPPDDYHNCGFFETGRIEYGINDTGGSLRDG